LSPFDLRLREIAAQCNCLALIAGFEHHGVTGGLIVGIQITEILKTDVGDFPLHEVWAKIEVSRRQRRRSC
jgi:hypothetical protein